MCTLLLIDLTSAILGQVGNTKLVSMATEKLVNITEPLMLNSMKSVLVMFGKTNDDKLEKELNEFLHKSDDIAEMKQTMEKILDQLTALDSKLTEAVSKIVGEVKFQPIFKFFGEIDSSVSEFEVILSSYGNNRKAFLKELEKFMDNYKAKNIEYKLINYLDSSIPGSEPFINTIIEKARAMQTEVCCEVDSSPLKFVHDFYVVVALKIFEGNSLLRLCYQLQEEMKKETEVDSKKQKSLRKANESYLHNRQEASAEKLRASMKNSLGQFGESKHLTSYLSLTFKYDDKPIIAINGDSKNKFYTGLIKVERDGYVVTGVRLRELYDMMFIQIQVGKLIPMGMIDQETVYWQELPSNIGDDYTSIDKVNMSYQSLDDGILLGIKFSVCGDAVGLQFYFRKLEAEQGAEPELSELEKTFTNRIDSSNAKHGYLQDSSTNFKISSEVSNAHIKLKQFSKQQFFGKINGPKSQHPFLKPFFDGSNINFEPKVPLSGGGLMHYTNDEQHAGLIVPFLKTLKYRPIQF